MPSSLENPTDNEHHDAVSPDVSISEDADMSSAPLDPDTAGALQDSSTGRDVAKATAGVGIMHLLRFVIGFLAQPLIAHNLGLQWQADAYAVSTDIIQRLWLLWEKVVNPAFLPTFIGAMKAEGEERAWRLASTATMLTGGSLLVATPLAYFLMPRIVGIYSPNAGPEEFEATVRISRILLGGLFFLGISSLTYTILNGYKRFAIAALGDTLWKLGIFAAAVAIVAFKITPDHAITVIAIGYISGALFKLLPHLVAIGQKWRMLRFRIDWSDPLTKTMMMLALPLVLGIVVSEARGVYLQRLADDKSIQVEAGRAALKWSRIIGDNLIQVFPYALSIGIFPYLADMARDKDRQPLTDTLMGALRVCFFTFAPITMLLIALRFPLLRAVWESGRLTHEDTIAMSGPFVGFSIGLVAFSSEMMINQTFYAMTRAWAPTLIGIAMSGVWVLIAYFGIQAGWGLTAIAASEAISKTLKCLIMWVLLRPHLGDVRPKETALFAAKVLVGGAIAAVAASFIVGFIAPDTGVSHFKIKMLLAVVASGLSAVVIFFVLGALLGLRETQQVLEFGGKIRRKFAR